MNEKVEAAQRVAKLMTEGRARAGLSQAEAARRAGISDGRWRQLERGIERRAGVDNPASTSPSRLIDIAQAIDLDPAELLAAAGVDVNEHRHLSERLVTKPTRAGIIRAIDVSDLAPDDVELVEQLLTTLRKQRGR